MRRFLKQTNLDWEECKQAPSLKFMGQRESVIAAMRFSNHPSVTSFLEAYDSTNKSDRRFIPLQLFALKANVDLGQLVGAYVLALRTVQAQKSAIVAMQAHPEIVESTIEFARQADGSKDRRMLHEAVGFVPTPKGANINIFPPRDKSEDDGGEEEGPPDVNDLFPLINDKQERWQANRQKLLEE